jgi:hypothetical protein
MNRLWLVVGFVFLLLVAAPAGAQTPLAAAKNLYLAAAYEDALAALDRMKGGSPSPAEAREVELYRAYCLLALKRQAEATKAIEALVALDPLFRPQEGDASPWVREAFQATRRRILPSAAQQEYQNARAAFGRREYAQATAGFQRVLAMLKDPDLGPADADPKLADLRVLAQGFLELSQAASGPAPAQTTAQAPTQTSAQPAAQPPSQPPAQAAPRVSAKPADAPTTPQSVPPAPPRTSTSGTEGTPGTPGSGRGAPPGPAQGGAGSPSSRIYTSSDSGITPPVPVYQQLPRWSSDIKNYTPGAVGVLETVIDETGQVTSAVMRQSVHPIYDALVVTAARTWLYKPATRDGKPVKFRRVIEVLGPARLPETKSPV